MSEPVLRRIVGNHPDLLAAALLDGSDFRSVEKFDLNRYSQTFRGCFRLAAVVPDHDELRVTFDEPNVVINIQSQGDVRLAVAMKKGSNQGKSLKRMMRRAMKTLAGPRSTPAPPRDFYGSSVTSRSGTGSAVSSEGASSLREVSTSGGQSSTDKAGDSSESH